MQIEGTFHAHQVPISDPATHPEHLQLLEDWLRSYRPDELFDETGRLKPELAELAPKGDRRMGANPHANGGKLLHDLALPDFRDYAVHVPEPGTKGIGDTHELGRFIRDVIELNEDEQNFRVFGPDETASNGLEAVFDVTDRQWDARTVDNDESLAPAGRVMEMLSEHQCEGWLEGYLLTGRHGLFNSYEAFIHIVDSMFNQHAKWLKVTQQSAVATQDRFAELLAGVTRLATRPQRIHAPRPRLHRPRRQQKGVGRTSLSATGCKLLVVRDGSLPAKSPLRQRRDRRQASGTAVVDDGGGGEALCRRNRCLGLGQQ